MEDRSCKKQGNEGTDYEETLILNLSPVMKAVQMRSFRNVYRTLTR